MQSCQIWIQRFLKERDLRGPDQRPLYQYHCTADEYWSLVSVVKCLGGDSSLYQTSDRAAFVLFCAEWYRRQYVRENGWSWEPLFSVLGFSLDSVQRERVIPAGLQQFWRRPVHRFDSDRRDFLGSLFWEGGLPFQVLREVNNPFLNVLRRMIEQHDRARQLGSSPLEHVRTELGRAKLPQVFSRPESQQLFIEMVAQLVSLVRDYELHKQVNPVAILSLRAPKWRERFPIPLDNETGNELLNGLLRSASEQVKTQRELAAQWQCTHFWSERMPDVLQVSLGLPKEVSFTFAHSPNAMRFELVVLEGEEIVANAGPAYARLNANVATIRPLLREVRLVRCNAHSPLSLALSLGGSVVARLVIEHSVVLFGEEPVGFAWEGNRWALCGHASFDTPSQMVLLVLPDGTEPDQVVAHKRVQISGGNEEGGVLAVQRCCGLSAVQLHGVLEVQVENREEIYCIRTGHAASGASVTELEGQQVPWQTVPRQVFLGLPKAPESLLRTGARMFVANEPVDTAQLQAVLGAQYVALRDAGGKALLRRKVGILPSDFRISLSAAETAGQAVVRVTTNRPCAISVLTSGISVRKVREGGATELHLTVEGLPPATFCLRVAPSLLGDPIRFELPFPRAGCLLFDSEGVPVERGLSIDQLQGMRLFLFGQANQHKRFDIEMQLRGHAARNAHYQWRHTVVDQFIEISLFSLRSHVANLLSLEKGIDQTVQLRINGNGRSVEYLIRRHSAHMVLEEGLHLLSVQREMLRNHFLPKPVLILLREPGREPLPLRAIETEGVATGDFEIPVDVASDGPWLIVPGKDSAVTFRACFVKGKRIEQEGEAPSDDGEENIETLSQACVAFRPNSSVDVFAPVFDAMASDFEHSGWNFLKQLDANCRHLPMPIFEVWSALIRHPTALAVTLFKFHMRAELIVRFEQEFPVFKEFLPISALKKALELYVNALSSDMTGSEDDGDDFVHTSVARMLGRMGRSFPAHGDEVRAFLSGKPFSPQVMMSTPQLHQFLYGPAYQDLLRMHADDRWPEFSGDLLARWHQELLTPMLLISEPHKHRHAVLYLPVFAAAVAAGQAKLGDYFTLTGDTIFFLRQVRDFDQAWFNCVFESCLARFLHTQKQNSEVAV